MKRTRPGCRPRLLLACLLATATTTWMQQAGGAEEAADCAAIADAEARLACYDRRNPPVAVEADEAASASQDEQAGANIRDEAAGRERDRRKQQRKRRFGLSDWLQGREQPSERATIVAVHSKEQQKMILQLDNGDFWIQNAPRLLPFHAGDEVVIRPALMGGYIIRNSKGVSSRFSLIEY